MAKVGSSPSTSIPSAPPSPASPEPSAKVALNSKPTLTPMAAAVVWLSTAARSCAPKRVRATSQPSAVASATTSPIRNRRYAPRSTPPMVTCRRRNAGSSTGCCDGPQTRVAAATAMNVRPIVNNTWSRWLARYRRRYSVASSAAPTAATAMNTMGSVAKNGRCQRRISATHRKPPSMAKAPCARLTKLMSPIVTDRPRLMRNSNAPYATPSKITPSRAATAAGMRARWRGGGGGGLGLLLGLARVLDLGDGLDLDVEELAAHLLHFAHVDVLDHVARRRIDADRPARALDHQALDDLHRLIAVDLAV